MFCRVLLAASALLLMSPNLVTIHRFGDRRTVLVKAFTQGDVYGLMDSLFSGYRPEVRPTDGTETYVYVTMYLLSIQDLDERSQVLETSIILQAHWQDAWLSWNQSDYGNISHFLYPQSKVWLPDIVIENSVESQSQLGYNSNLVRIDHTGWIMWKPTQVIHTGCDIDVTYYPFDTQECSIIVSTWMSSNSSIKIESTIGQNGLDLTRYSESGTWELASNSIEVFLDENGWSSIRFKMSLERLRDYYILNIILPVLFLSFTTSMVFFLPAEAGEKIGMGITVLLAYAVYLSIIADNMPQTSQHVSYLSVYLTLLLGFTTTGVTLSVGVLHIHHKSKDINIGTRTVKVTRKLRKLLYLYVPKAYEDTKLSTNRSRPIPPLETRQGTSTFDRSRKGTAVSPGLEPSDKPDKCSPPPSYKRDDDEEEITWVKVAETLDRVMFILTSCLIVLITLIFFPILALGP